jgi:hypothetical protein
MAERSNARHRGPGRPSNSQRGGHQFQNRRSNQRVETEFPTCPTLEVVIPRAAHEELGVSFYNNKIVLAFEGWTVTNQAKQWILQYNCQNDHELRIFDPLANGLYLVEVISTSEPVAHTIRRLLDESPLSLEEHNPLRASKSMISSKTVIVDDRKASVNHFTAKFWASNPADFCYLVYFQIQEGNNSIYGFLDTIFQQIGKVVRSYISPGIDFNRIVVLVEMKK